MTEDIKFDRLSIDDFREQVLLFVKTHVPEGVMEVKIWPKESCVTTIQEVYSTQKGVWKTITIAGKIK